MISVLIEAREGEEERLTRTLASLVPAAVEGVVREAMVVDAAASVAIARVVDHAGCRVAVSVAEAAGTARGDWLLLLEPGARLLEGWSESVLIHAEAGAGPARFTRDASVRLSLGQRLRMRGRPLARGLLVARGDARLLAGELARLRPVTLAGRIVPAP